MKKHFLILAFYTVFTIHSPICGAQTITNSWYGSGIVDLPNNSNNYLAELIVNEKNKKITGVFNYYFRDSLFSNKIEGLYNPDTRRLTINKQNIIFYRTINTKIGIDCPMYGEFNLRTSRIESVLNGVLYTDNTHKFTCPSIIFNLKHASSTVPIKPEIIAFKKIDTTTLESDKKINPKQLIFATRNKIYTSEITVANKFVTIELYDNGQIDYDSVTLYLNDKMVLPKTMLTHNAIRIKLPLNDSLPFNQISMFADNLGLIPPNTAALILYDGKTRYEVMMSSDLSRTATIKLISKVKKE